jgi:hypothetical protein
VKRSLSIPRRSVLRGAGALLGLPWLEAMSPYSNSFAKAGEAAASELPARLAFLHYNLGMQRMEFFPKETGPSAKLSRILAPLEASRGRFTVFSNTYTQPDLAGHAREVSFLTGTNPSSRGGFKNTISYDQIAAGAIGQATRFPSLVLSQRRGTAFGSNLVSTLSWNRAGIPIAAESSPQILFARLFRPESSKEKANREALQVQQLSVLDSVRHEAQKMNKVLGENDRAKLDEYFNSIRELEQQIERVDHWAKTDRPQVQADAFGDLDKPFDFSDCQRGKVPFKVYSRLMFDLIALAWQTDSTRVFSYAVRQGNLPGDFDSPIKDHHAMTHDGGDPVKLDYWARLDELYMGEFHYFLEKLASIQEGTGTLLDRSLIGFSSEINGTHSNEQLPTVLAGGTALGIHHKTHVACSEKTLVGNLWETMMAKAGVPIPENHLLNSSGLLPEVVV